MRGVVFLLLELVCIVSIAAGVWLWSGELGAALVTFGVLALGVVVVAQLPDPVAPIGGD